MIFGLSLFGGGLVVAMYLMHSKFQNLVIEVNSIQQKNEQLKNITQVQGQKILFLSKHIREMEQNQTQNLPEKQVNKAYQQAAIMLTNGVDMEEIMDCCDLTKGEIQLISQMEQSSKNTQKFH